MISSTNATLVVLPCLVFSFLPDSTRLSSNMVVLPQTTDLNPNASAFGRPLGCSPSGLASISPAVSYRSGRPRYSYGWLISIDTGRLNFAPVPPGFPGKNFLEHHNFRPTQDRARQT